ncbi:MAG: hypothetical protein ACREXY_01810, partial [Gammaproteobacteria bacterium]
PASQGFPQGRTPYYRSAMVLSVTQVLVSIRGSVLMALVSGRALECVHSTVPLPGGAGHVLETVSGSRNAVDKRYLFWYIS